MTLRQLELFVAVVETGNFSRAAEKIRLTQSTVSQHISALEAEVGSRLLDRDRNGAFLTAAGQLFLQHARRIIAERDLLLQSLAAFNGLEEVRVSLGASNIPGTYLIPPLLPRLAQQYPGLSLNMCSGDSRSILAALAAAEIELAVVGSRLDDNKFSFTLLTSELLVLVVGAGHRWWQCEEISLAELQAASFVGREAGSGSEQALLKELQRLGVNCDELNFAVRLGSNEAVLRAVASGFGCAFVSERSVQRELATGELHRVAVSGLQIERQFWLAKLRGRTPSPAATAVAELLLQAYAEQPG